MGKHARESMRSKVSPSEKPSSRPESVARPTIIVVLIVALVYLVAAGQAALSGHSPLLASHSDGRRYDAWAIPHSAEAMNAKIQQIARQTEAQLDAQVRKAGLSISDADRASWVREVRHRHGPPRLDTYRRSVLWILGAFDSVDDDTIRLAVRAGSQRPLISILFGSINVGLFYWLLSRADRSGLCLPSSPVASR